MVKFAKHCLNQLNIVVHDLTEELGPGTENLAMRFGIHSGAVTAGVLRGEKSRFQLFGDTVNTAARMETNGAPHKIHISSDTADLLIEAGKEHWIKAREDLVKAKGKGEMQTYWVVFHPQKTRSSNSGSTNGDESISDNERIRSPESDSSLSNSGDT